jgi:surface polysaccharide O-acyltransferase-like enzyme
MDARVGQARVLACFMVVLLHVAGSSVQGFTDRWPAGNFYSSLTRASVPIFFMIAGATLLGKQEPLTQFVKKRLLRIVPPLLLWSVVYLAWLHYWGVATSNWFVAILSGPTMYHLWYFYATLGLYAFVPLLRRFVHGCTNSEVLYVLSLWFFASSALPAVWAFVGGDACHWPLQPAPLITYNLSNFAGYFGFFLLGYLLRREAVRLGGWRLGVPLFVLSTFGTVAGTYLLSARASQVCDYFYVYLSPLVVLAAAGLFISIFGQATAQQSPTLGRVAGCTLGVYGVHILVLDRVEALGIVAKVGNAWIATPLIAVTVFLCSLALIDTARRIRPLRVWI